MKRLFVLVIALLLAVGCVSSRVLVGNVSIYNADGEKVHYYQDVEILTAGVSEKEVYSNIRFKKGSREYFVEGGFVTVEGLMWAEPEVSTSIYVYPSYPYYYRTYPRYIYRSRPVRPAPPAVRPSGQPSVRRNDGGGRRR